MSIIDFLTKDDVLAIHRNQIERYGGSMGLRDPALLESAIAMPDATFAENHLHADLYEMAAAYLFHITQNHPFIDGNKRVGIMAAIVFLAFNEIELIADEDELEMIVMKVASGNCDKDTIAKFFRNNTTISRRSTRSRR